MHTRIHTGGPLPVIYMPIALTNLTARLKEFDGDLLAFAHPSVLLSSFVIVQLGLFTYFAECERKCRTAHPRT